MLKKLVIILLICFLPTIISAKENKLPAKNEPAKTQIKFRFLLSEKVNSAIDYIEIYNAKDKLIGKLKLGENDSKGESYILPDPSQGRWGALLKEGELSARFVNGQESTCDYSPFVIGISEPLKDCYMKIRYKDIMQGLIPIEYFNSKGTLTRIGQLYMENSKNWIVDELDIPNEQ